MCVAPKRRDEPHPESNPVPNPDSQPFHTRDAVADPDPDPDHDLTLTPTLTLTDDPASCTQGRQLFVANVGDSRAVLAERTADGFAAIDLTQDQTPYRRANTLSLIPTPTLAPT